MNEWTVDFTDERCLDIAMVGGKGANLGRMTSFELPVPPGFCVTTAVYEAFIADPVLQQHIAAVITQAEAQVNVLEQASAELRDAIVAHPLRSEFAEAIVDAYRNIGAANFVAVRSSGTAEDLTDASFAGLHDTYLHINGSEQLLDAVRRCWASMWTARATSYRATRGIDQASARIAVVVQQMVEADVAGVMFTANPLTDATDEIVINATWGLGEALVSGIATPDEHILATKSLRSKSARRGAKELRVIRDPETGSGTITEAVPDAQREKFALSDHQVRALGRMGQRVTAFYGGLPQDIEWAISHGELFILQSRPITGAEFSWDEDLECWQHHEDDGTILWTRSWADEVWNGAISPLTYSYRAWMFTKAIENSMRLWGLNEVTEPIYRYHRATAYYNTRVDQRLVQETALPPFRAALLAHVPPDQHEEVTSAPLTSLQYLRMIARITIRGKPVHGALRFYRTVDNYLQRRVQEADGLSYDQLTTLSDDDLIAYFERFARLKQKFTEDLWTGFFIFGRDSVGLLAALLAMWYDPDPQPVLTDLLSGLPKRTATAEENLALWRLSERIRSSVELRELFDTHGRGYLEAFTRSEDGRRFLDEYNAFAAANGHRGHADRDLYFPRRADDPSIDFETFRTLLAATDPVDPEEREQAVTARREAVIADVERKLRGQRLGGLRVKLFRGLLGYAHRFFLYRDNQRHYFDRYTYSMRRGALEFGRRLAEHGALARRDDVYFLGRAELYGLLRGEPATPLMVAKIAGRRANFERMLEREASLPKYLRDGRPVSFGAASDGDALHGVGTSRGRVTGRARIIRRLNDIGQVQQGDILVTNSTDPGWTPVFTLLSGIVLETGGMLAHGSCLAREYGFPAVQVADATRLIPEGATITVNGDTGQVELIDTPVEPTRDQPSEVRSASTEKETSS